MVSSLVLSNCAARRAGDVEIRQGLAAEASTARSLYRRITHAREPIQVSQAVALLGDPAYRAGSSGSLPTAEWELDRGQLFIVTYDSTGLIRGAEWMTTYVGDGD